MNFDKWKTLMAGNTEAALDLWAEQSSPEELTRINLKVLAPALEIPMVRLLEIFIFGVKAGAFFLNWEYRCPHCRETADFKHNFRELQSHGFCGPCNKNFDNSLDSNVEVTFTVHPSLSLSKTTLGKITGNGVTRPMEYLSGFELLNNRHYREAFGNEVLGTDESLAIGRATLLFTDIKDSTRLYATLGDQASYKIVREHFKVLFRQIEDNGGIVVKTIGDAVMASFVNPRDGVKAALGAYEAFKEKPMPQGGQLEVKMGLHAGSVIAVTMNNQTDYFGNTVNTAARIQSSAQAHTVCFSKDVLEEPGVKTLLAKWGHKNRGKVLHSKFTLKGLEAPVSVYRILEEATTAQ